MLSGARAFKRDTMAETLTAILREEPADLRDANRAVSPALARVVTHCLEKRPSDRFQTASDLAFALDTIGNAATIPVDADAGVTARGRNTTIRSAVIAATIIAV